MTYWARGPHVPSGSVKDANITGAGFIPLDKLAGSCSPGPNAKDVIPVMGSSRLLGKVPSVNNEATTDTTKDVFGLDPVLICADINSPHYGIWGLNATGDVEIRNWEQHPELGGAPWGYYVHIYADVPNAQQYYTLRSKGGGWSAGADQQMQDYKPDIWKEVRRLMGFPDAPTETGPTTDPYSLGTSPTTPGVRRTGKELTFIGSGRNVKVWYAGTPQESGSKVGPHPGIALAGPQVWNTPDWGTPQEVGMPGGVALVTMDDPSDKTTIRPAKAEADTVADAAARGIEDAQDIADYLGIPYDLTPMGRVRGFFD